ncbi:hypothetical protein BDN72DRAFT_859596 [Pluteus cervinus]|uniref:Uncharacterized protein n=1 Tax=Pluteus cervinus TaxID=181527 RepID=A0ACD3AM19_9AGAR|nr:hypothetical protein BDN72DRAFT_859596 [Pluteus cervinus]
MVATQTSTADSYVRSDRYWFDERVMVYAAGTVLFRVAVGRLTLHSGVFEQLMGIPSGNPQDGTEEHPIMLAGVEPEEFSAFLGWLYHVYGSEGKANTPLNMSEIELLHILKLSQLYMAPDGVEFAFHHLNGLNLSPSRQLELGLQFDLHIWVFASVKSLLLIPLDSLEKVDLDRIGFEVYVILMKGRERLAKERHLIATYPPVRSESTHVGCTIARCDRVWKEVWWMVIARRILHPKLPLPLRDIPDLVKVTTYASINKECLKASLLMIADSNAFQAEHMITESIVNSIIEYHATRIVE